MKYLIFFLTILLMTESMISCKKDEVKPTPLASLNVINGSVNLLTLKANFTYNTGTYATSTTKVVNGANKVYTLPSNTILPITIVSADDTLHPVYKRSISFNAGDIYSLYLAGQTTAVDTILQKDIIPYHGFSDSTCGIRFINLSFNSTSVNITLSSTPTVNEFSTVAYKSNTDFKTYSAMLASSAYTFQVRDAGNTILATYSFTSSTIPRFYNCTLALVGQIGGTGTSSPKLIRINNY